MSNLGDLACARSYLALSASAAAFIAAPAMAQEQQRAFDIPSQALASALLTFSQQSDQMIVASPDATRGKRSRQLRGMLAPSDAIARLLSGSGLRASANSGGGYLIEIAPAHARKIATREDTLHQPKLMQSESGDPAGAEMDEGGGGLSEIVVTAQRREENLQDVPVAVSAISAEALHQNQITDVNSLQRLAPSLTAAPFGDATSPLLAIRGQVAQDILASVDPAVGVYVDGIYLGRATGANLAFIDVERVEVLRGPQGTLFGRNTIGGAISITPKPPVDYLEGQVTARYGNYDAFGLTGVANIPVADGAAFRIAASHSQRDGFARSSLTGADLNAENLEYVRASFKAELGPKWEVLLSGDFSDSRNSGQWLTLIGTYPIADTLAGVVTGGTQTASQYIDPFTTRPATTTRGPFISRNWGVSGIVTGSFGDVNFKSLTAYREVKRRLDNFDQDATPFDLLHISFNDSDQHQFSQEFQLFGKAMENRLDWIVGAYYFSEVGRDTVAARFLFPFVPTFGVTDAEATNRNYAIYGQLNYAITDQLSVLAGIRYTKDTRQLDVYSRTSGATPDQVLSCAVIGATPPDCLLALPKKSFDYVPFAVGLNYQPSEQTLIYLKWSRGFRSGGYNSRGESAETLLPFDPEKLDSYELGAKFEFDRWLRLNAAIYQSNFVDQQLLSSVPGGSTGFISINQNAGKSRIRGIELEAEAAFGNLRINGGFALTDAEFRKLLPTVVNLVLDSPFVFTPKTTWSLGADYKIPASFGEVVLHTDFSWRSRTFYLPTPPRSPLHQQPSYGLLNASVAVNLGNKISVTAFGRNLTDKKYFSRTTGVDSLGFENAYPGDPRTYGVSATYRF